METWEMIKELTENPSKRFTCKGVEDGSYVSIESNVVVWKGETQSSQELTVNIGNVEWEEVKRTVDFMTAFDAIREKHKDIYCIYEDTKFEFKENDSKQLMFGEELIAFGKWYIED